MMKKTVGKYWIKFLGNFRNWNAGDVVEVEQSEAAQIVGLGYAVFVDAPVEAKE